MTITIKSSIYVKQEQVMNNNSVAKRQWVFFRAKVVFVCGYTYGPVT